MYELLTLLNLNLSLLHRKIPDCRPCYYPWFYVGCAYVIAREFFNNKIKSTEDIDALGVNVYATIPFSTYEKN